MTTRRSFLAALAALPVVGRYLRGREAVLADGCPPQRVIRPMVATYAWYDARTGRSFPVESHIAYGEAIHVGPRRVVRYGPIGIEAPLHPVGLAGLRDDGGRA